MIRRREECSLELPCLEQTTTLQLLQSNHRGGFWNNLGSNICSEDCAWFRARRGSRRAAVLFRRQSSRRSSSSSSNGRRRAKSRWNEQISIGEGGKRGEQRARESRGERTKKAKKETAERGDSLGPSCLLNVDHQGLLK